MHREMQSGAGALCCEGEYVRCGIDPQDVTLRQPGSEPAGHRPGAAATMQDLHPCPHANETHEVPEGHK